MKKFFKTLGWITLGFIGGAMLNENVRTGAKNAAKNTKDAVKNGISRITTKPQTEAEVEGC